jgi:putative DNA primase/helicase
MLNFDRQIIISAANSRKSTYWPQQTLFWSELVKRLETPARGSETLAEYLALPKSQQDELKDVGGFVGGALQGGRRKPQNVIGRDIITLDLDNIPTGGTADTLRRIDALGCAYAVYSTRKHSEAKPRLRVLFPTDRTATADEYEPLARKLGQIIGIELCDPTTFQVSRLMYWPSCCADSQYIYTYGDKAFLSVDGILAMYTDWRNINEWPGLVQQAPSNRAAKQADPESKTGIVGAFCKTYNIYQAMDQFLPGVYVPCDDAADRFTYSGGSTTGGAVIYDNGTFLYSHHATDPAGGKLVNAFDLVRLHLYSDKDDDAKPETPTNRLPSFLAMCQLAISDQAVASVLNQERYAKATDDFNTYALDNGQPVNTYTNDSQPVNTYTDNDQQQNPLAVNDVNWMSKLALNMTGQYLKTVDNCLIILENDPWLKDKIAFDEFANRGLALGPLPWDRREGRRQWTDIDDAGLRHYLEKVYNITGKDRIFDATALCAHKHTINDVKDYLTSLVWDGTPRLDTLFIDYLGANDTPYVRAVARKSFTAAVARAMTPGCKYDYMPILAGPQGIGKSTLLRLLGLRWYSDSLQTFEGKEASEMLQGTWINELGELTGLSRAETNAVKQFLSRTADIYREPYGRRTAVYPRRCVFFGTTNDSEFLQDRTGNRRFWPVDVGINPPTKNVFQDLQHEIDQIWAEAKFYWQMGEPLYLTGEIEIEARREQESHREASAREGLIKEFLERPVPVDWDKRTLADRRLYWSGEFGRAGAGSQVETMPRYKICAAEIWAECFNKDIAFMRKTDAAEINAILKSIEGWIYHKGVYRFGPYGPQRGFLRI